MSKIFLISMLFIPNISAALKLRSIEEVVAIEAAPSDTALNGVISDEGSLNESASNAGILDPVASNANNTSNPNRTSNANNTLTPNTQNISSNTNPNLNITTSILPGKSPAISDRVVANKANNLNSPINSLNNPSTVNNTSNNTNSLNNLLNNLDLSIVNIETQLRNGRNAKAVQQTQFNQIILSTEWSSLTRIGVGFVYKLTDDRVLIATAYENIKGYKSIQVFDHKQQPYDAKVVGFDAYHNLALLQIKTTKRLSKEILREEAKNNFQAVKADLTYKTRTGDNALIKGHVSKWLTAFVSNTSIPNLIQIDSAIDRHSAGSPLFNAHGTCIGVLKFMHSNRLNSNYSVCTPIGPVLSILEELETQQTFKRGKLDLSLINLGKEVNNQLYLRYKALGFPATGGLQVAGIQPSSQGYIAGLRLNDIIYAINDIPITNEEDVRAIVTYRKFGDKLKLGVFRPEYRLSGNVSGTLIGNPDGRTAYNTLIENKEAKLLEKAYLPTSQISSSSQALGMQKAERLELEMILGDARSGQPPSIDGIETPIGIMVEDVDKSVIDELNMAGLSTIGAVRVVDVNTENSHKILQNSFIFAVNGKAISSAKKLLEYLDEDVQTAIISFAILYQEDPFSPKQVQVNTTALVKKGLQA